MGVLVQRYDVGTMASWERTPQGGLRIPSNPTRVGVFPYIAGDGSTRREYRPADEVFSPDSLATLRHAPVTDLHPEKDGVRVPVTPENFRDLSVGHVAEDVHPEGDSVAASLLIQDAREIRLIEAGERRELSCGYGCTLDFTPGVTSDGQVFDVIQRDIVYNHVAIGPQDWGRQGASVALKFDAAQQSETETPVKETIDGKEYTIGSPEWVTAIQAQRTKIQGDLAMVQGRADALEKRIKDVPVPDPKAFTQAVVRRSRLVTDCARIARRAGVRFDAEAAAGSDEGSMIAEAIKILDPSFDPAGKEPAYLMGYFNALLRDMAPDSAADATTATETPGAMNDGQSPTSTGLPAKPGEAKTDSAKVRSIFSARTDGGGGAGNARQNAAGADPDKARSDMIQNGREAWKKPLATHK